MVSSSVFLGVVLYVIQLTRVYSAASDNPTNCSVRWNDPSSDRSRIYFNYPSGFGLSQLQIHVAYHGGGSDIFAPGDSSGFIPQSPERSARYYFEYAFNLEPMTTTDVVYNCAQYTGSWGCGATIRSKVSGVLKAIVYCGFANVPAPTRDPTLPPAPTARPTPQPTPSPVPTPSPTSGPTPSPTPSPSPSPTPRPVPTASPIPTPEPTDQPATPAPVTPSPIVQTEAPTADCATDYFPYNTDCSDTASDGCSLLFNIEVDLCTLNQIFTKYLIKLSSIVSLQDIVIPITTANNVCTSPYFALFDLTVTANNYGAQSRANDKPKSNLECPILETRCVDINGYSPGFTLQITIALYCKGNAVCEDVELVASQLVNDGIESGSLNTVFEDRLKSSSMGEDTICQDGFGDVEIQSLGIKFIDADGVEQEIGAIEVDEDDVANSNSATKKCYFVAVMIVLAIYCFFV